MDKVTFLAILIAAMITTVIMLFIVRPANKLVCQKIVSEICDLEGRQCGVTELVEVCNQAE